MKKLIVILLCIVSISAYAKIDDKFIRQAAQEVWSMDYPMFDARTEIPDSISQGQSAVVIASLMYVTADYTQGVSIAKERNIGNLATNIIKRRVIKRKMVKLLDEAAIEAFSSVDLTGGDVARIHNYQFGKSDEAFGARVHKPSGEVIDVDVSKALSVTSGKKGKEEVGRRLAIPSLAVGDVIEFFTYDVIELDDFSPDPIRIVPFEKYPVLNYEFDGIFAPEITVEYRCINDAPEFQMGTDDKGHLVAYARFANLPEIPDKPYFLRLRQMPYYRLVTLNNNSAMVWHPKQARKPGLYSTIPTGTYYGEVNEVLTRIDPNERLVKSTEKYMKNYRKAHPDDTRADLLERAWIAMLYYYMIDSEIRGSDLSRARAYREVLRKLKLDDKHTGIGFVNSRYDIPSDALLSYSDLDYVVVVGDTIFQSSSFTDMAPGEFPAAYQGETGGVFYSDFIAKEGKGNVYPQTLTVPVTRPTQNLYYSEVDLTIDVDNEDFPSKFSRQVVASGAAKENISLPVSVGTYTAEAERYLEIPEDARYTEENNEADQKELKERMEQVLLGDAEASLGVRPVKLTSFEIEHLGCFPTEKKRIIKIEGTLEGLVTDAGDGELIVDVGRLFGKQKKLSGPDRERDFDAVLESPSQTVYVLNINVPDGYAVDDDALASINKNLANKVGMFNVQTNTTEARDKITISVTERYNPYVVPDALWPMFLDISDAAADFNSVSIVLQPK